MTMTPDMGRWPEEPHAGQFQIFDDAVAARRLRDRVAREIAAAFDDTGSPATDLLPVYRWLSAIADQDVKFIEPERTS